MRYTKIPMVPGPVSLHPYVLQAMQYDYGSGQREEAFPDLYHETAAYLQELCAAQHDVAIMTGEGILALWAGLKSCLKAGDKVLCVAGGVFGDGIGAMAKSLGCEVKMHALPHTSTLHDMDAIARDIELFQPRMITAVHCETPSGTLNPLAELGALKKEMRVPLFYVDAVASIGGTPVLADQWNIDIVLGGSQKCLSAPPSMSFVLLSEQAWRCVEKTGYEGYDALSQFRQLSGRCPYTPYWHGMAALHAGAKALIQEGLENVFVRHEAVAAYMRKELTDLGFTLYPDILAVHSPTVTAVHLPSDISFEQWDKKLRQHGLVVGAGLGPMAGKLFRLGHMGMQADMNLAQQAMAVIKESLAEL